MSRLVNPGSEEIRAEMAAAHRLFVLVHHRPALNQLAHRLRDNMSWRETLAEIEDELRSMGGIKL